MIKIKLLLIALLALSLSPAFAELYKWVDDEGNISYSDQPPFKGANEHTPPEITQTPAVKVPEKKAEPVEKEKKDTKYAYFKLSSPENDQTIRDNQGNFTVSLSIKPPLNTEQGHYFSLQLDGQVVQDKFTSMSVNLNNIDRGTHKINAIIKNNNGKTLQRSNSVTVHLHRKSILTPAPR